MRAIVLRVINACWFCFKWGLIVAAIGVVTGLLYVRYRMDDEIRLVVETMIGEHYADLDVSVRAAQLVPGEGIAIRGVSLVERGAEGPGSELAYFEEIFLTSRTDLEDLLTGNLAVSHVAIRRPLLRATRRPDRQWSLSKLLPLPDFSDEPVDATIENATIEVFDPQRENAATYTLRDIHVAVKPTLRQLPDGSRRVVPEFEGSLSGDFIRRIEFRGWQDPAGQRFSLGGRVQELAVSREVREAVPRELADRLETLDALRGLVGFEFRIGYEPLAPEPWQLMLAGQLKRGRLDDPRLPYPLTDLQASFRGDQRGYTVEGLTARSGQTTLRVRAEGAGYEQDSPLQVELECKRLLLDRQLAEVLPDDLRQQWRTFQPAGEISLRARLKFDGSRWHPQLLVDCSNVSFSHQEFPYRLEQTEGTIEWAAGRVKAALTALADSRPVALEVDLHGAGDDAVGHLTIRTQQLPLSNRLFEALPAGSQQVVREFNPRGTIDAYVHLHRDRPGGPLQRRMMLQLHDVSVSHERFRYPVQGIHGTIDNQDQRWSFLNLRGRNDTGLIVCDGRLQPAGQGTELVLNFAGKNVPLDQELRQALPDGAEQAWRSIRPSGSVDLTSRIRYLSATRQWNVEMELDLDGESLTIEPAAFPYRIERLRGRVAYRDGLIEFHDLKGVHGRTLWSSRGRCTLTPGGGWELQLTDLHIDHLRADRDLIAALPHGVGRVLDGLALQGPVNVSGGFGIAVAHQDAPPQARWDLQVTALQGAMRPGIELADINGGLRLAGEWDGSRFQSRGWIDLDSIRYKDLRLTRVRGPLWIDNREVRLGAWADPGWQQGRSAQRMSARCYGGEVWADARIVLDELPRYMLRAEVVDADLRTFAVESLPGQRTMAGRVAGNLELQGVGRGTHSLRGGGSIQLREATLYELPLVVSLLKILSVRAPDPNAFSSSDIKYRISGEHVYFDEINFYGDAVSLLGKGELDFNRNVRMVFHSVVGNDELQIPLIRPVLGLASRQLMLIYVDGSLDNPRTTTEALPGVRRAVEDLQVVPPTANERSWWRQAQDGVRSLVPR